jgi:hypothetical protein
MTATVALPACVLWLYGLLWLRGTSALAVLAITTTWAAAGHLPAAMSAWRPAAYARHHDAIWTASALLCALIMLRIPASGSVGHFRVPGAWFKNLLMPALMVYFVQPMLTQLAPGWQLVSGSASFVIMRVTASLAPEGAFPLGNATHVALLAASVGIACVLEWRSRSRWLHARVAAPAPGAGANTSLNTVAPAAAGPSGKKT